MKDKPHLWASWAPIAPLLAQACPRSPPTAFSGENPSLIPGR